MAEEAFAALRELAPDASMIVITGYATLEDTITAFRHGAVDYLLKPIEPRTFLQCVARAARLRRAEARARQAERLAAIGHATAVLSHECTNSLHGLELGLAALAARHPEHTTERRWMPAPDRSFTRTTVPV